MLENISSLQNYLKTPISKSISKPKILWEICGIIRLLIQINLINVAIIN